MQLTKQTNYAIRTLVYCAANAPAQSRVSEIAHAYEISELSLFKFIKPLVDNGLLLTVRGRNGGIKLAKPAEEISMGKVVLLTEESFALAECFGNDDADCPLVGNCDMNLVLHEALSAFLAVLDKYTIADLARRDVQLRNLLGLTELHKEQIAS